MNEMKGLWLLGLVAAGSAFAAPPGESLSASLDVQVYPKEGQVAEQQSQDEAACYDWAVSNSGVDPFELQKQADAAAAQGAQPAQASTRGAGARGAVRGAAAGAVIGEVADDDAGKGAAYGAAVGAVAGRRESRRESAQSQQQVQQQGDSQQETAAGELGNFKNAFGVCLEGRNYLVKY